MWQREKGKCHRCHGNSANLTRSSGTQRALRNCPSLSGECQSFVLLNDQSLDVGCSRKWGDHGQKEPLQLKLALKRLTATSHLLTATCRLLTASPGSEAKWLFLKEDGAYVVPNNKSQFSICGYYLAYQSCFLLPPLPSYSSSYYFGFICSTFKIKHLYYRNRISFSYKSALRYSKYDFF